MALGLRLALLPSCVLLSWAGCAVPEDCGPSAGSKLRGRPNVTESHFGNSTRSRLKARSHRLRKAYTLIKRFDFGGDVKREFDVVQIPDQNMTHSCANYVDDGSTAFTSNGRLHLKVSSACTDSRCLNSGRVMSRDAFTYGIFTFSAKVPKCNSVWPALWLLPESSKGNGKYGPWPCSGEIDVLETVHGDPHGAFNLVGGRGLRLCVFVPRGWRQEWPGSAPMAAASTPTPSAATAARPRRTAPPPRWRTLRRPISWWRRSTAPRGRTLGTSTSSCCCGRRMRSRPMWTPRCPMMPPAKWWESRQRFAQTASRR
ncbi:unnamed protein product [Effrenium voratum]|uniref:GH16 domain-containing protein n=1 Tax=Effrenium voratum TaxID=2562239 RepID=A0AA36MTU5_9DINO|nr:unnamed protein product [Effrenium voratum]